MSNKPRWKHQDHSITFFSKVQSGFDFSDPGTGKTRVQIESFAECKTRKRMLIVAPKTLMQTAWGADIEEYAPKLTVSYAYAGARLDAFTLQTDVVIINTDGVKELTAKEFTPYLKHFTHLVIDESNAFKNPQSKRSKAMEKISKGFTHKRLLTGTPTPNTVMELFHPTKIIDGGRSLGTSYTALRNKVQQPTQIGPKPEHVRWDDKPGADIAIREILAPMTVRHDFETVMSHVPANHRSTRAFNLTKNAWKRYEEMRMNCMLQSEGISAVHAASLRTKLLQIASGAVYSGQEDGHYVVIDRGRYELIAELVEERDHSIVFFNWKHQRDMLAEEFEKRDIKFAIIDGNVKTAERVQIVADYQAGKYQTLLLHPRTGAHGLTLTRGTTTIISSPIYEADMLKQAIHRIYRGDQNKATNTILIEAKGTVEAKVYARLNDKYDRMMNLLDLLKE
jgi:SNF2 family DNA or RNA helicase